MNRVHAFLELAVKQGGSDVHLVAGEPPRIRIHGLLHTVRFRELSADDLTRLLEEIMDERQTDELERHESADFAIQAPGLGRFRANVYRHTAGLAVTFRHIPETVIPLEKIGLPEKALGHLDKAAGLSLVTGPTGSGKSTTLAAIIDHINRTKQGHIITVEDPIEFVHAHQSCVVTQREIGTHARSFPEALHCALREDPNVILVGELRDLETMSLALTAAETGVQVFGTLHTNGAVRTVDRIVNMFPADRQEQVRTMLADSLRLVISQQLVQKIDGKSRLAVAEVMANSQAVESLIRAGKTHQLASAIQSGARDGMQLLDAKLSELVQNGEITGEEAYLNAVDKAKFERLRERQEVA